MKKITLYTLCLLGFAAFQAHAQNITSDTLSLDTAAAPDYIPVFTVNSDVFENQALSQNVSGILQASRDVFAAAAGFRFSVARFRMRGLQSNFYSTLMNGVPVNDPERGWAVWSYWGGLNDVTRYQEVRPGIVSSSYGFTGIGGYSNINLRATSFRSGTRISYALSNRTYRHRPMVFHATGMMDNGWAVAINASARYAEEGYVEGTYYSGASYFLAIEKKINDAHTLNFATFNAPTVRGRQGIALQEAYDLAGTNYYNPYWGYQNGEKRNARMRSTNKPYLFLTDYWTINDQSKLTTTLMYSTGKIGNTNLNWYNTKDPRPDYYKYLPSYYKETNPEYAAQLEEQWKTDVNTRQIKWDDLIYANQNNIHVVENANGQTGNTVTGLRSKYIVEEYINNPHQVNLNAIYDRELNDKIKISSGVNAMVYKSRNYKVMDDLLGGDYWVDINQFAEQVSADPLVAQNDLETPNKIVKEGDKFGYDYAINQNFGEFFTNADFKFNKIEAYAAAKISYTQFWRTGYMQNGLFPDNSKGDSEKQKFLNYGIKAGSAYKITGRHIVSVNGAYYTQAPNSYTAYVSPKTRDQIIPNLESAQVISGDVNYMIRYPKFKMRATAYYTQINNQVWQRSFYHDVYRTFVNYSMTNVDQLFTGVELGFQADIFAMFTIDGALAKGQYLYNSRPLAYATQDNSQEVLFENRTIYIKNYHIGGMPETAATLGIKYNSPKYWYIGVNANYFDDIWLSINPDRRTEEAISKYVKDDPQWKEIVEQTKLNPGFTLDAYAGKSWKIKKYIIRLNLNVSNVLNNQNFVTGGFEQLRYDSNQIDKFPPKLGYMYGLTYFGMISVLF